MLHDDLHIQKKKKNTLMFYIFYSCVVEFISPFTKNLKIQIVHADNKFKRNKDFPVLFKSVVYKMSNLNCTCTKTKQLTNTVFICLEDIFF